MLSAQSAKPGPVAFIGLGMMGLPMSSRLLTAGFRVRGADLSPEARASFAAKGGEAFADPAEAARGCALVITMLPTSAIVRRVVLGDGGVASVMAPGSILLDMSSSVPLDTRQLAADLAARGVEVVDAPVSGGVARAVDGTLAIMVGGRLEARDRVLPVLEAMGRKVIAVGAVGAGHAAKVLNNYVSACGLVAACEALLVAERFGIEGGVLVDVLNASTGRNNSTEVKLKPFVLSGRFNSGFALALMAKDLRIAADLAEGVDADLAGIRGAAALWEAASGALGRAADHTEIFAYLSGQAKRVRESTT